MQKDSALILLMNVLLKLNLLLICQPAPISHMIFHASKTIQINDDTVVLNPKDVWTKSYSDTTPIDVITQTKLGFRIIYSEGSPGNNNSQWIFPDEYLNAQAGNYLLTVSQTYKLYLVSVFYIVQ